MAGFRIAFLGTVLGCFSFLATSMSSHGQAKPIPSPTSLPQAPILESIEPNGAAPGETVTITVTGKNLSPAGTAAPSSKTPRASASSAAKSATTLLFSFAEKVDFSPSTSSESDPAKSQFTVTIPKSVPMGVHFLRVGTRLGVSDPQVFCVDEFPRVGDQNSNHHQNAAQEVTWPCVITGRIDAETSDFYRFRIPKASLRVGFEILSRRIGSSLDPILKLYDASSGQEVPGIYSDDEPGLQGDARLTYTFERAGEYLIEVRDATHRGGNDYHYRLRIGEFPCAITPWPVAVQRGHAASISFAGPNVEGVEPATIQAPSERFQRALPVTPRYPNGMAGWPVELILSDYPEQIETEPNNESAHATPLAIPSGVTGRFSEKADLDAYVFSAKKGDRYTFSAETYQIHSPVEVYMALKDAQNKVLARSEPDKDPRIDFDVPADGEYYLHLEHLNFEYGPLQVYHLRAETRKPDFEVRVGLDRVDVAPGSTTVLPVSAVNRSNYNGPIELSVVGPPGIDGSAVIPKGRVAKNGLPVVLIPIRATEDAPAGAFPIHIRAVGTVGDQEIVRFAHTSDLVAQRFGGLLAPPRHLAQDLVVGVTPSPRFTLRSPTPIVEVARGVPTKVKLSASRGEGVEEDIQVQAIALPPNVTAGVKPIAKGTTEVDIPITTNAKAPLGEYTVAFRGSAKLDNRDFAYDSPPITLNLTLPFSLALEANTVTVPSGGKVSVKVTAQRKGGYAGPIELEVRNLPGKVSCPKVTIPEGQDSVVLELSAEKGAQGMKNDVNVLGKATKAENQTAASANFTVKVES